MMGIKFCGVLIINSVRRHCTIMTYDSMFNDDIDRVVRRVCAILPECHRLGYNDVDLSWKRVIVPYVKHDD